MVITVFIKNQTTNIALNCLVSFQQLLSLGLHRDTTETTQQQQQQFKRSPCKCTGASQVALVLKNPLANAGDTRDMCLIPGSRRSPGGRNGNPLQYSCLENPMDIVAWQATVHRVTESGRTEVAAQWNNGKSTNGDSHTNRENIRKL